MKDGIPMVEYDAEADAAYVRLSGTMRVHKTVVDVQGKAGGSMINLDFDMVGRLIGIEVLDASARLSPALLSGAKRLDKARKHGVRR